MASIRELMRSDARSAILRALANDPGYSLNHRILRTVIDRMEAISLSEDEVKVHLAWLEDRGAVETEAVPPFTISRLTDYGLSLAKGHVSLDGVSRPPPSLV